ncbi:phage portal protein [Xanthobacteraceae bacterium Astr-EGSB]|uniref:phage portal protein n=1 Tax=Astrobacterium formosum TaxID=3069710 RepID=UPI0027B6C189|nr:phage portal protein [Xanthobacteraceae bacterium Astr-EGSB]
MLHLLKSLLRSPETKASRTARVIRFEAGAPARWTPRDYAALAREGFVRNAVVHRAVKLVAENVGQCAFLAYEGARLSDPHPLTDLLARPNPRQEGAVFLESLAAHLLIAGNAYVEAVALGTDKTDVRELYSLRPDRLRVVPGPDGWASAYDYVVGARSVRFEQAGSVPPILHLTLFNPLDDHYGLGALEAAAIAVDTHNAAASWNKALLDNAARPSGALVYDAAEGGILSDNQYERLKAQLEASYVGAANAGRPMVLEGGLDWKPMSLTPKDMDFLDAKHAAAREIALAFGVPPMLLGIPGDNTYANYREANLALWRTAVLPLAGRIGSALAHWLAPAFGDGLALAVDTDRIEALAADRAALWARVGAAAFLTDDEKREMVGFGPRREGF